MTYPPPRRDRFEPLPQGGTIGIVGGGQLGRMSAMAAARLGYKCRVLTQEPDGPAAQVCAATIGPYEDPATLHAFAQAVDVVTFEFENISTDGLDLLASLRPVFPSPAVLRVIQDRVTEKSLINATGIGTAHWLPISERIDLDRGVAQLGLPAVLKTTRLGYDGRGQMVLRHHDDLAIAWDRLSPKPLILEAFVDFACELSVIVARGRDGGTSVFDPVENRHRNHILDLTLAPAQVSEAAIAEARDIASRLAAALDLVGLLAVEMFMDRDGAIVVNELAPRPHNSGHWTIEACPASQFDMHIRAVAGLPLPPAVRHADAVMKNLIGAEAMAHWPAILATPGLVPHCYGKAEARPGRKMGHVTRLFPRGALPGAFGLRDALGILAD
jgi:5-(carboxyamino)imidazole ribonucleotide synthase